MTMQYLKIKHSQTVQDLYVEIQSQHEEFQLSAKAQNELHAQSMAEKDSKIRGLKDKIHGLQSNQESERVASKAAGMVVEKMQEVLGGKESHGIAQRISQLENELSHTLERSKKKQKRKIKKL